MGQSTSEGGCSIKIEINAGSTAMSSAKAVELADLLQKPNPKLVGARIRLVIERPDTQSLGAAIAIAAGLPAVLEVLRIAEGYLMRDGTPVKVSRDETLVFEGEPKQRGELANKLALSR